MKPTTLSVLAALPLALAACNPPEPQVASLTAAIAEEHEGGVAQLAPRVYTTLPDETLTGYAMPHVGNCSAEMIGPNLLMTAAHCNDLDHDATFTTYQDQDPEHVSREVFHCHILLNTFWQTDVSLHYCDPNSRGEAPGDKYGYLDFDHSQPHVGQAVYSYWHNPVDRLGLDFAPIYSKGTIEATDVVVWGPLAGTTPMSSAIGIGANLWSQPGASGSALLNASNFRMLAGPTSTSQYDSRGRYMQSIKTELELASVNGWDDVDPPAHRTGVHDQYIASRFGLAAAGFAGKLDKDGNYLFDIQEAIENLGGENPRDWYYLGFESERRNALWTKDPSVSFDPAHGTARVRVVRTARQKAVLRHARLPLAEGAKYRVSFRINVAAASSGLPLTVRLLHGNTIDDSADVLTSPGGGWKTVSVALDTSFAGDELALVVNGTLDASLTSFSVIRDFAVMDFDSADKRWGWRNDNTGGRALVLPDGMPEFGASWAGLARPTNTQAAGTDWPLGNRELAIVPHTDYRLCAVVRYEGPIADAVNGPPDGGPPELPDANPGEVAPSAPASASAGPASSGVIWRVDDGYRTMRVLSAGQEVVRASFIPSAAWTAVCTGVFSAPTADNEVQLGFAAPTARLGFFVDNVRLVRVPCGSAADGCATGNGRMCVNDTCQCEPHGDPCASSTCGEMDDGCGHMIACGTCAAPAVCHAYVGFNHCECPPGRVCQPEER
jgi:hypothetical protein